MVLYRDGQLGHIVVMVKCPQIFGHLTYFICTTEHLAFVRTKGEHFVAHRNCITAAIFMTKAYINQLAIFHVMFLL